MFRPGTLGMSDDELPIQKADRVSKSRREPALEHAAEADKARPDFSFQTETRGRITSQDVRREDTFRIVERGQGGQDRVVRGQEMRVAAKVKDKTEKKRLMQAVAITAPPGADEKTKRRIEKIKEKIQKLREKQVEKRKKQLIKWASRPDVLTKWSKRDAARKASHDRKLAHYMEKDAKEAARRMEELEKAKSLPDFAERKARLEAQWTRHDARVKSARAHQEEIFAEREARHVAVREKAQRRRDQVYNFVGQFVGWPQRPLITPAD